MTIIELQEALDEALECEGVTENTDVLFRHSITEREGSETLVEYLLMSQTERGVLLCYEGSNFF